MHAVGIPLLHTAVQNRLLNLFRCGRVPKTPFSVLVNRVGKDRDLLKARMKTTAYNQHDVGSFSEPWSVVSQPIYSLRRANVVIQSSAAGSSRSEVPAESKNPCLFVRCKNAPGNSPRPCGYPFFARPLRATRTG